MWEAPLTFATHLDYNTVPRPNHQSLEILSCLTPYIEALVFFCLFFAEFFSPRYTTLFCPKHASTCRPTLDVAHLQDQLALTPRTASTITNVYYVTDTRDADMRSA
jgi:hypothetical protein